MDKTVRDGLLLGAIGFALGVLVGAAILALLIHHAPGGRTDPEALIRFILFSGVYGALGMGASVVYRLERWSITRATVTHLLIALGGLYALGLAQGWLSPSVRGMLLPTLGFIAVYFLIWLAQYLAYRREVSRMNQGVKALKSLQRTQSPSDAE